MRGRNWARERTEWASGIHSKSDLTDLKFSLKNLDSKLFPGVKSGVKAHDGFLDEHAKTASQILTEVKTLLSKTGATQVITVSLQVPSPQTRCSFYHGPNMLTCAAFFLDRALAWGRIGSA